MLNPLLADGKLLICDKYYYDDVATKAAFGCPYEWLKSLHYDTPKPDVGLYLKVDGKTLIERNRHRADGRIIHYQNPVGVDRLLYYYEQIVIDEHLTTIDANASKESISESIMMVLEEKELSPQKYQDRILK